MSSRHARTAHSKSAPEWLRQARGLRGRLDRARFEYLTLVLWAETGVLPVCDLTALACLHDSSAKAAANVAWSPPPPMPTGCEHGPHRWDKFYKWSHSILNGHEVCDCGFIHGRPRARGDCTSTRRSASRRPSTFGWEVTSTARARRPTLHTSRVQRARQSRRASSATAPIGCCHRMSWCGRRRA